MVESTIQILSSDQREEIQRHYLRSRFSGTSPTISDKLIESDGRKRSRLLKEAINAGWLEATGESSVLGTEYRITAEVIASVIPASVELFELWQRAHESNPNREAYERPWIWIETQPIDVQCSFLEMDNIDWFIVSQTPYKYVGKFADDSEKVETDARGVASYSQYWAGPFPNLDDAIARRREISNSSVAISSAALRQMVAHFFAEQKIERMFVTNLLWGLVEIAGVPTDLVYSSDGKPILDSQLEEGHSLRFDSNINMPEKRAAVEWQSNLAKSIERLKSRIAKAEQQLDTLRVIDRQIASLGGWATFKDALDSRLRAEIQNEKSDSLTN